MTTRRAILLIILFTASTTFAADPLKDLSRHEFAERLATIQKGMTVDRVREILGKPDEIRDARQVPGVGHGPGEEFKAAWCYGTSGHLTLATLGQVNFNTDDKVMRNPMERDAPLPPADFDEAQMRKLLHLLDDITGPKDFKPQSLIAAVNALQPLGTDKALTAIEEYARIGPSRGLDVAFKMSFLVQALFSYDRLLVELKIVDDVPFVPGIMGGYSGPPARTVVYMACRNVRNSGLTMRAKPLEPTTDLAKLREDAMKMAAADRRGELAVSRVSAQFDALIEPIVPMLKQENGDRPTPVEMDKELSAIPVRWDAIANRYAAATK